MCSPSGSRTWSLLRSGIPVIGTGLRLRLATSKRPQLPVAVEDQGRAVERPVGCLQEHVLAGEDKLAFAGDGGNPDLAPLAGLKGSDH